MENTTITLISVLATLASTIAAAISAMQAYRANKIIEKSNRNCAYQRLIDNLNIILQLGIQYPYFEDKKFTSQWTMYKNSNDEKYMRYDNYCNLIYNYWHDVYNFFDGNRAEIENYLDIKNWIRTHEYNWSNPVEEYENLDGYDKEFRDFINYYIK